MQTFRKDDTVRIAIIIASLLITFRCYADEIYVEGETSNGTTISRYLETDDYDYAEGYLKDEDGKEFSGRVRFKTIRSGLKIPINPKPMNFILTSVNK